MRAWVLGLAMLASVSPARADAWPATATGYVYAANARCATAASAALKPNEARYDICADQMAVFKSALEKARSEKRLLIVDFGATWCPWCRSLQAQWATEKLLGHKDKALDLSATFNNVEIGISTLHAGRMTDVASGHAVLDHVLAATNGVKLKSVPFLAVIDPEDRSKTIGRSLDDFEQPGTGQHAPSLIRGFLGDAYNYMRNNAAAPSEPGWVRKKFNRAWLRLFGD